MRLKKRYGHLPYYGKGLTVLGWFNFLILQWFWFRLEATISDVETMEVDYVRLIGPIVPLTGWWSRYINLRELIYKIMDGHSK